MHQHRLLHELLFYGNVSGDGVPNALLEIAVVMMKPTMVPVVTMLEVVVELSTLISVIAILMSLMHLDRLLLQLEMDLDLQYPCTSSIE